MKKKILFLCTGNSCRSQMAEGFGKKYAPAGVVVFSAGIEAHGLNPRAVAVMAESGVDISQQTSDLVTFSMMEGAMIITLCGHAKDNCPVTPPECEHRHWGLDDPAQATGTEEEVSKKFRDVRDEIERRIMELMTELKERVV